MVKKKYLLIIFIIIFGLYINIIHPSALETPDNTEITYCYSGDEGRLLINWNVINVDGYELLLAQNSTFTRNAKTFTYSREIQKASLNGLERNVIYYVKIRTFNEKNGTKIYSNWSDISTARIHAHNYKRILTKQPTCTESGIYTFSCECKRVYKAQAKPIGHNYKWVSNNNETMSFVCQNCGDVKETKDCNFKKNNEVKATCENDGYIEYICNDCGSTKKDIIEKFGHDYQKTKETGTEITYTCRNCGNSYIEEKVIEDKNDQSQESTIDQTYSIDLGNGKTTTVTGHFDSGMSEELFELLNNYRESKGLNKLSKGSEALQDAANIRATEITYLFDHKRPNGERALLSFTNSTGCCAENLGKYQTSAEQVMNGWINSSTHNANMLSKYPEKISISVFAKYERTVNGKPVYSYHFVQLFGWNV